MRKIIISLVLTVAFGLILGKVLFNEYGYILIQTQNYQIKLKIAFVFLGLFSFVFLSVLAWFLIVRPIGKFKKILKERKFIKLNKNLSFAIENFYHKKDKIFFSSLKKIPPSIRNKILLIKAKTYINQKDVFNYLDKIDGKNHNLEYSLLVIENLIFLEDYENAELKLDMFLKKFPENKKLLNSKLKINLKQNNLKECENILAKIDSKDMQEYLLKFYKLMLKQKKEKLSYWQNIPKEYKYNPLILKIIFETQNDDFIQQQSVIFLKNNFSYDLILFLKNFTNLRRDKLILLLKKQAKKQQNNHFLVAAIGSLYFQQKDLQSALLYLNQSLNLKETAIVLMQTAKIYEMQNNDTKALQCYKIIKNKS